MKFLVIGSGLMGSAIAYDLARSQGVECVTLADISLERSRQVAEKIGSPLVHPIALDANDYAGVVKAMGGHDGVVGATSFHHNYMLSRAAIESRVHFCDLGGNDQVVEKQLELDDAAREASVAVIPNCGLAPGLANILAARGAELFDSVDSILLRVGGLPQRPKPPFSYELAFSVEGLLNEYSGKSTVLRNGTLTQVDALTETEMIQFPAPFGTLEAFHTSGGVSRLPQMFAGRVSKLDYKTIRYPGHCERFRMLLDLGFGSNDLISVGANVLTSRELFAELLKKKLEGSGKDVVLLRVWVRGERERRAQVLTFEMIDFFDENDNITAMMRTTAYPTSVIIQSITNGMIPVRGVATPETCVPLKPLLEELSRRNITVDGCWS